MIRPLTPTMLRALALGAGLAASFGCGTHEIELRETSRAVTAPEVLPGAVRPEPTDGELDPVVGVVGGAEGMPAFGQPILPSGQVPNPSEVPPSPVALDKGCQQIDFLFVIDNSDSMDDEQANLATSFPGFIKVMQLVLEAHDFHIMVVSTGGDREDEDEPTLDAVECGEVQGAGRRLSENEVDCGIEGGLPFMLDTQPELEATFACAAQVGTDGASIEKPIDAIVAATGAALNAPGRCNAGFLREDALLVVTFITDEEDRRSEGDPEDWRQALLDAKHGNEDAVVLLGLVGDNNIDGGLLGGPCRAVDADGAPRLQEVVGSLDGVLGSVCAPDYTPFFQTAAGSINRACSSLVPPAIF
jgi:hypothetical protein